MRSSPAANGVMLSMTQNDRPMVEIDEVVAVEP